MSEYFTSTSPGKTWNVYFYKPQGRPGYYTAIEGEREFDEVTGYSGFRFTISYGAEHSRSTRKVLIEGPCTAKKKAAARGQLLALMLAEGLIEAPVTVKDTRTQPEARA